MKELVTYLNFDGKAREAMKFYEQALGGKVQMMTLGEAQVPNVPPEAKDRIMHARLTKGNLTLMASDTMPGMPFKPGNNFGIAVQCESGAEVDRLAKALSEQGQATMPVGPTSWAEKFGMVTDKYGVGWMFTYTGSVPDPFAATSGRVAR